MLGSVWTSEQILYQHTVYIELYIYVVLVIVSSGLVLCVCIEEVVKKSNFTQDCTLYCDCVYFAFADKICSVPGVISIIAKVTVKMHLRHTCISTSFTTRALFHL